VKTATQPLADRMRPRDLNEIVGQHRWLGPDAPLRHALDQGRLGSMVLWGPPGCGKTTLARVLAGAGKYRFVQLSAVLSGVKDLRQVVDAARDTPLDPRPTLLFVDEIHRWNKAQQDALLPHIEDGTILLVGATTENPSFSLNPALRSRLLLVRLEPLEPEQVQQLLQRALTDPRGYAGQHPPIDDEVLELVARASAGDVRRALTDLERIVAATPEGAHIDPARAEATLQRTDVRHDRDGEDHYNVASALIKSLRGSDPDAALYWLARLIAGGEDPRFIARRLVIFASEDVGNADPRALQVAVAAADAVDRIGMPEGRIPLAQAATFLASAPKSNAAYLGINAALADVKRDGALPVPLHLRNAPTKEMTDEGYGVGYAYPHDHPFGVVRQSYLPERMRGTRYYEPKPWGEERTIGERLAFWQRKLDERDG
jgi:putative ATPase